MSVARMTPEQYAAYLARRNGAETHQEPRGATLTSHPRPVSPPGMANKLERRYVSEVLEPARLAGEVLAYRYEAVKLRLAPSTFYTPDYLVVTPSRFELHECKGHWEEDARVKTKTAAQMFPWFVFVAVQRVKGEWRVERFGVA